MREEGERTVEKKGEARQGFKNKMADDEVARSTSSEREEPS